jgi:hypothetical protein
VVSSPLWRLCIEPSNPASSLKSDKNKTFARIHTSTLHTTKSALEQSKKKKIGPEKSKLKIIKVNLGSRRGGKAKEGF